MTTHRRYQYAATAGTVLLAALTLACAHHGLYAPALYLALGTAVLAEAAVRERRQHQRAVAECEWARRRELGHTPPPLEPCCLLSEASHGAAHRNCTSARPDAQATAHPTPSSSPATTP
ncbi:hypothetical protein [Streptomyces fructofermentans]|uniref:Uncharacterized protein n=1 Tax=Streptomyces fructofermentans TaxID=152141 RepID=A0A918U6E6_9ACTN|nr:hypothetical protein [Streptomyces fructofermentans]GGX99112.1 hypothetical protein GCM10010515_76600 [Streptomyces fructofermentans]